MGILSVNVQVYQYKMGISVLLKSDMLEYFLPYIPMSKFHRFFIIPVDDDLNKFESLLYNDVFKHLTICPEYWFLKIFNYFLSVLPGKNLTPLLWSQYTPEDYKLTNLNLQNLKMNRNILLLLLTKMTY